MVSTETLQVVINAKDMLSSKVKQVNEAIRQTGTVANTSGTVASNATNRIGQAYDRLRSKVNNVFNNIKNTIKNSTLGTAINESGLARPFLNAAEQIKQRWSSMTETLKSKLKGLSGSANASGGFNISAAGLATLNGQVTTTTGKISTLGNMINKIGGYSSTLGIKLSTAFATAQTKVEAFKSKLSTVGSKMQSVVGGLSGVQSAIMSAFGAVGVTSLSQFTIGAAVARQKLNAVTTGITGSEAATKRLNQAISAATNGGIVGFTKVAQAVQQIGIKYNLTNQQLEATAPVLNKIGTLARAMGKDSETAATIMSKAYDGLNGNFMLLQRNLGITKQQLLDNGWSGASDDVDGYTMALNKVLDTKPEMQEYLNSYEGQMERLKLAVGGVGRQIGEVFLPILNALLGGFLELHQKCPWLTTVIVGLGVAILGLVSILSVLAPIIIMVAELWTEEAAAQMLALGPYVLIAAAIIAVIAIMWHLYNTNENVRNAINKLGDTIRGILVTAWENLQRIIQPIIPTFQHLFDVIGRLCNQLLSFFGITSQTGEGFDTWTAIAKVLGAVLQVIVQHMVTMAEVALSILVPALNFIVNVIASLLNFLTSVGEALALLMQGDILGFLTTIMEALDVLLVNIITSLGQMLLEILNNLGLVFGVSITMLWNWIVQLVTGFVTGAVLAVTGFISWISSLPGQFWTWLMDAINRVLAWKNQLVSNFRTAATNAINGFISYIQGLPGKFWTWLVNTYNKVSSFKSTLVQKISDAARSVVDNFKNKISSLPTVMWNELMNIKYKIQNAVGSLGAAIRNLGSNLLSQFKSALGIASPGHMSHAIEDEMGYIGDNITNSYNTLSKKAAKLGNSIMSGFNSTMGSLDANVGGGNIGYTVSHDINEPSQSNRNKLLEKIVDLLDKLDLNNNNISNVVSGDANAVRVVNDGKVTLRYELDFINAPAGMSNSDVEEIVRNILSEKETLKQLTNNREFQDLDKRMKVKILSELSRHI